LEDKLQFPNNEEFSEELKNHQLIFEPGSRHCPSNDILKTRNIIYQKPKKIPDCLCGLVVRVPGRRPRSPGFDSWLYQIFFSVVVGLEGGPLSLRRINEELLERKHSDSGLENRD
jgi:hypothetical protein